jgi:hypothetical protein
MDSRPGSSGRDTAIVALVALLVIALVAFGVLAVLLDGPRGEPTPQPASTHPVPLPTALGSGPTLPPPGAPG